MIDSQDSLVPEVDETGRVIGPMTRREAHSGSRRLHPVVHLHVFNSHGQLYLQQRPHWKDIQPDKWDTAVGGHVDYGETILQALHREVSEEIGISDYLPQFVKRYIYDSQREREMVHVYMTTYDGPMRPDSQELSGGRFWDRDEIDQAMGQGILTPNFEEEYTTVLLPFLDTQPH